MRVQKLILTLLLGATLSLGGQAAWAQPDTAAPPIAPNPANQTPEAMRKEAMAKAEAMMKMTPDQQKVALQKMMDDALRLQLNAIGVNDEASQNAILECITSQEKERDKVRVAAAKIFKIAQGKPDAANDANTNLLLNAYLAAVDDAKVQREEATNALDLKIGFSQKPRLMAYLTVIGIIGDAAWYTGGIQLLGSVGMASMSMAGNLGK